MLKVRVSKVTSEYLRDDLCIEAGVWYDVERVGLGGWVNFPGPGSGKGQYVLLDGPCAHLEDNEQTEWEVSDA